MLSLELKDFRKISAFPKRGSMIASEVSIFGVAGLFKKNREPPINTRPAKIKAIRGQLFFIIPDYRKERGGVVITKKATPKSRFKS